jgi:hypothetical protein
MLRYFLLDIFFWHTLKQMLTYLGAKIICLAFMQNLEWGILGIDFHFAYFVNLKCQTRCIKSLHIEAIHGFPLPPAGAPQDEQNCALLFI